MTAPTRVKRPSAVTYEEWEFLRDLGYSMVEAADQLGIQRDSLMLAIRRHQRRAANPAPPEADPETWVCSLCDGEKPVGSFPLRMRSGKQVRLRRCQPCLNAQDLARPGRLSCGS